MPTMYVMRGAPGSGKSTVAKRLRDMSAQGYCVIASADDFFVEDGEYVYDGSRLSEAHARCFGKAAVAMASHQNVVVDNTNLSVRDFAHYVIVASLKGYHVVEVLCYGEFRNIHDVPEWRVKQMREQIESWPTWLRLNEKRVENGTNT